MELIVLLAFLALLVGGLYLIVRVIRRALDGGSSRRIRELEGRVRDLEKGR